MYHIIKKPNDLIMKITSGDFIQKNLILRGLC